MLELSLTIFYAPWLGVMDPSFGLGRLELLYSKRFASPRTVRLTNSSRLLPTPPSVLPTSSGQAELVRLDEILDARRDWWFSSRRHTCRGATPQHASEETFRRSGNLPPFGRFGDESGDAEMEWKRTKGVTGTDKYHLKPG